MLIRRAAVSSAPGNRDRTWHLRVDRADATDVEITFTVDEGDHCRVEIEHRGWERLGDLGLRRRDANQQGWAGLLPHFVAACRAPEASAPEASGPE